MARIKIAIERDMLFNVKLAIVFENGLYLDKIKALLALEIQDFKVSRS